MRVLLIQPTPNVRPIGFDLAILPEPLGLEVVAASIPEHEVEIVDLRLEPDLHSALNRFAPDVVAITALTTDVYAAQDILKRVKGFSEEIFTVVGGLHATLMPEDFQQSYVDVICLGDGEIIFPLLMEKLTGLQWTGSVLGEVSNLIWRDGVTFVRNSRVYERPGSGVDAIPMPRRDLIDRYRPHYHFYSNHMMMLSTGRGCPSRCNFCSVWQFYGGFVRQLSARRVVDELQLLDSHHIGIVDDNFLINRKRDDEIADLIKAEGLEHHYLAQCRSDCIVRHRDLVEKWVGIGLGGILLGLEGASDEMLQLVNKRSDVVTNDRAIKILRDLDVIIWAAFIIDPQWSVEDFDRLEEYILRHQLTPVQYTVLTPLPGTDLYIERYDELLTHDYRCYDTMHSVLPTKLPREEFYRQFARLQNIRQIGKWQEWLGAGKVTMDTLRCGSEVAKKLGDWELYTKYDPVLGGFI